MESTYSVEITPTNGVVITVCLRSEGVLDSMVGFSINQVDGNGSGLADPSLDIVFDVLSDPRRRYTIAYLTDQTHPVRLADLVMEIADWESNVPVTEISEQTIEDISISLYHHHLPRLEAANIIEYDSDSEQIHGVGSADRVRRVLSSATNDATGQ